MFHFGLSTNNQINNELRLQECMVVTILLYSMVLDAAMSWKTVVSLILPRTSCWNLCITHLCYRRDDATEYGQQISNCVQLEGIDEDSTYAIFISYVGIYNNIVYDLLEDILDFGRSK